jgi:hypothetical protein
MIHEREERADHGDPRINELVARLRPINAEVV